MKMYFVISLILVLALDPIWSAENKSQPEVGPQCESLLYGSEELTRSGFAPLTSAYGERGFLGFQPEVTTKTLDIAGKNAIIRGEQLVYLAANVDAALRHSHTAEKNGPKRTLYLIKIDEKITDDVFVSRPEFLENSKLLVIKNGTVIQELDEAQTWKLFNARKMSYLKDENGFSYFSIEGWMLPARRSVVSRRSVEEGASTYGSIRKFTAEALSQSYMIAFNKRPQVSVKLAGRKKQENDENNKFVADGEKVQKFIELINDGSAFSVEVYAPSDSEVAKSYGQSAMVAGVLGYIQGNVFVIDSIFYPSNTHGSKYANMAIFALLTRLITAGIEFIDTTKITHFANKELRAISFSSEELVHMISKLPDNSEVDFNKMFSSEEFNHN
ncbi:MAG: hypothetical protein H6625_05330 [Bdellovibrionaceae bacterium]|nr:hypothetical protein [Pseudobdellovibrionaceae bacterium]